MKSRLKRKLAALLAFVMIATSVMPAIAEMGTEALDFVENVEKNDISEIVQNPSEETVEEKTTEAAEIPETVENDETVAEKETVAEEPDESVSMEETVEVEVPAVDTVIESTDVTADVVSVDTEVVTGTLEEIGEVAVDGVTVEEVVEVTDGKSNGASIEVVEAASEQTVVSNREVIVDGVRITITADEGVFPEDAELYVQKITDEETEKKIDEAIEAVRSQDTENTASALISSLKFDVKMLVLNPSTGEKEPIQPDTSKGSAHISFTYDEVMGEQTNIRIYHMKEDGDSFTAEMLDTNTESQETDNTETGESLLGASFDEEETETTEEGENVTTVIRKAETIKASAEIEGFSDYVITTEKTVETVTPLRPVWIMSHKCNTRGEITGEYGHESNNVKDSGCNAIEIDITYSDIATQRYGLDPSKQKFVGDHDYIFPERIFCTHSSSLVAPYFSDWYSLMTLSELFHDVEKVYPQITIIYLDIKKPECMPILNEEVHKCLDFYFSGNHKQMPYIVYSVAEPEDIFAFEWDDPDGNHTIDLWPNEGVCCDMDSNIEKIVRNFEAVGLDKVWVGNGTPGDTWDPIKKAGIRKAVLDRDDPQNLSIIKKVEYWTAARQQSVELWMLDDNENGWKCDSVMIADCVRSSKKKMTALFNQISNSKRVRYATIEDDPFQVSKISHEILFVYYDKNGNKIEEKRTYPAGTPFTPPDAPNVPALDYNCNGWKVYDQSGKEIAAMDRTAIRPLICTMQYTEDPGYTLKFESNGGSYVPNCHVSKSKPENSYYKPADPEKEGYSFEGWYDNPGFAGRPVFSIGSWLSDWKITTDLTVYAKWSKRTYEVEFTVDEGGGKYSSYRTYPYYGEMPTPPKKIPTKDGYDFAKWEPDLTPVRGNQKYTAKFVSQEKLTVTFNTMGGTEIKPLIVPKGEIPDFSDVYTERTGFDLLGFYYDKEYTKEFFEYETPLKESITLYAKWESLLPAHTVTWIIDGKKETTVVNGGLMPSHADPYKDGYIFIGWEPQLEPVTEDTTYTAKFIQNAETVVVSFNTNGGTYIAPQQISKGGKADQPDTPVKRGYRFIGWFKDSNCKNEFDFSTEFVNESITLYSKWNEIEYTIRWYNEDKTQLLCTTHNKVGELPECPEDKIPQKSGFVHTGWDPKVEVIKGEDGPITSITPIMDIEYKAVYLEDSPKDGKHVVYFDGKGGTVSFATAIVNYTIESDGTEKPGKLISEQIPEKVKEGADFAGWNVNTPSDNHTYTDSELLEYNIDRDGIVFSAVWNPKSYTITWDFNGGTDAEGKTSKTDAPREYGTMPSYTGSDPVKEGYIFTGWDPSPVPVTTDSTYKAKYMAQTKEKVAVSFNTQGGSFIDTQIIVKGTRAALPSTAPTKTGYTFAGWYKESSCDTQFDFDNEFITADTIVYAKWAEKKYTVTWNLGDKASPSIYTDTYTYGQMPKYNRDGKNIPVIKGYAFTGWTPALAPVTEDVTYTAQFIEDKKEDDYHVVFFDPVGGKATPEDYVIVEHGKKIDSIPTAEWAGHTFNKWGDYTDPEGKKYTTSSVIDKDDIVFTADWTEEKYTVTWTVSEDTAQSRTVENVPYGTMPAYPGADPHVEGYIFTGWYPALEPVKKACEYKANFEPLAKVRYAVSFNTMGGSYINTQIVASGSTATKPTKNPVRYGYKFEGWFKSSPGEPPTSTDEKFSFETQITQDTTVYAGWSANTYNVTWKKDGGIITTTNPKYKELPVFPEEKENDLKKDGYVHIGWNPSITVIDELSETSIEYEAVYTESMEGRYVVSFDPQGGSVVEPAYVIKGSSVTAPEEPTRAGYSFSGWYTEDGTLYNFSTAVNQDLKLIAKWAPLKYEIVWKDGESVLKTKYVEYDSLPEFGTNPEKEGYYFAGWDPSVQTVSSDAIYQAIFLEKDKEVFVVSFNSNGGTHVAVQKVEKGATATKPAKPAKGGYTFVGWYLDEKFKTEYQFTEAVTADITLYAKWKYNGSSSGGGGGGGVVLSGAAKKVGAGYSFSPNWYYDVYGVWRIRNSAGQTVANAWLCDDVIPANGKEVWYLLTADGAMIANGLVQDNTGNYYSLETEHNGYFGMLRYQDGTYNCNGQQVYLTFNREHKGSFGAITNPEGIEKLKAIYGVTHYGIGNEDSVYTASF